MIRVLGLWVPVVGFMVAVWFVGDELSREAPEYVSDKILHFLAYGVFGLFNLRAFHGGLRRPVPAATLAALLLTGGFGALDEWRQADVSFRDASWQDWVADLSGGLAAALVLWLFPFRGKRGTHAGEP